LIEAVPRGAAVGPATNPWDREDLGGHASGTSGGPLPASCSPPA
jgi:hypothetical protein